MINEEELIKSIQDHIDSGIGEYEGYGLTLDECKYIVELLKSRVVKKWEFTSHHGRRYRICPNCHCEREDDRSTSWYFCPFCGSKLKD